MRESSLLHEHSQEHIGQEVPGMKEKLHGMRDISQISARAELDDDASALRKVKGKKD